MEIKLTKQETEIIMELLIKNIELINYKIKMKQLLYLPIQQELWDLRKTNQIIINKIVGER